MCKTSCNSLQSSASCRAIGGTQASAILVGFGRLFEPKNNVFAATVLNFALPDEISDKENTVFAREVLNFALPDARFAREVLNFALPDAHITEVFGVWDQNSLQNT